MQSLLAAAASTTLLLLSIAPPAAADAGHEKSTWRNLTTVAHDLNICGDLATFTSESTGHAIATETVNGFHFTFVDNDVYTVDFDDATLGTWTGRATETATFNATPGDVITLHIGNNNIEGEVRIRELMTLVIGPSGEVRVERSAVEVIGC